MAAAYAALLCLLQTINDIQRHPSPPTSLGNQKVESLIDIVGFLQKFLEGYVSPDADGDEADPLEMRIADAAYAVEDVIESHIVHKLSAAMEEAKTNHDLEFPEDDVSIDTDGDEADPLEMPIAADAADAVEDVSSDYEWKLDVLKKIGLLPLLEKLQLWDGRFEEGKWEIGEGQFPSLKYLELVRIHNLEELGAEEGSSIIFPCLHHLNLYGLEELKEMSSEIGNIPTLRKIKLYLCNEVVVKCMKEIVEEQVELQDPLPFHVFVDGHLLSKADPNFEVLRRFWD